MRSIQNYIASTLASAASQLSHTTPEVLSLLSNAISCCTIIAAIRLIISSNYSVRYSKADRTIELNPMG